MKTTRSYKLVFNEPLEDADLFLFTLLNSDESLYFFYCS